MAELIIPSMTGAIEAYRLGREDRKARERDEAGRRIGGLMASGDYAGAASAAYGVGDFGTGAKLDEIGRARGETERRARLGQMAVEDPNAARDEALRSGDFELYKEFDSITQASQARAAQQAYAIIRTVADEPEDMWDDLVAANRARLEGLNVPAQEIDAFLQAAPEQRRLMMGVMMQRADKYDAWVKDRFEREKFEAQERDRAADNARADQQVQISRGQLGVSQANLAQRRAEHSARVKGQGGYAAPGGTVIGATLPEDY